MCYVPVGGFLNVYTYSLSGQTQQRGNGGQGALSQSEGSVLRGKLKTLCLTSGRLYEAYMSAWIFNNPDVGPNDSPPEVMQKSILLRAFDVNEWCDWNELRRHMSTSAPLEMNTFEDKICLLDATYMLSKAHFEELRTRAYLQRMEVNSKTELHIFHDFLQRKLEVARAWSSGNGRELNVVRGVCSQLRSDILCLETYQQLLATSVGHVTEGSYVEVRRNSRRHTGSVRTVREVDGDSCSDSCSDTEP